MAEERVKEIKMGRGRSYGPKPKIENPGKVMWTVLKYILDSYAFRFIIVIACIIISVYSNNRGIVFRETLIDDYIIPIKNAAADGQTPDYSGLLGAITKMAAIYAVGIAAMFIQGKVMIYITQGTLRNLRVSLFSKMEKLPIKYFDTHSHGDIMSVYTNDIDTLRQMISQSIPQLLQAALTIAMTLFSMIAISPVLTGVTLIMTALLLIVTGVVAGKSGKNFIMQQKRLGAINGFIEEMMEGQRVVKVFNHEKKNIEEFDRLNTDLYTSAKKANEFVNILGPINAQLGNLSFVVCAVVGGILVYRNGDGWFALSIGGLVSFLTFNKSFNMPITQVSQQFNSIVMALAGADRIFKLLNETPEKDEGYVTLIRAKEGTGGENELIETTERTGLWAWKHYHKADQTTTYTRLAGDVVFDGVDFGYNDDRMVLHDIKLYAKPGQKIALVGTTGAGKTTITNLLNRFYDIQDGKIRYDGININKIKKDDLRHSLGIVLQETHLFSGSIRDNIRYGRLDASDEEVIAAAKLANADGFIRRLPDGYDTVITGDGGSLSQGQRQLIAIARAAIADPPVLILDEATSSIDTRTEKLVQAGMDGLMKGRTTFVIAHRLSTVRNANCIMVMEQGRIIERGTHDELISQKGKYYSLYTGLKQGA